MFRIAFDPDLPIVASSQLLAGERTFKADEPIDWRSFGVSVETLFAWWQAGLVHHPIIAPLEQPVKAAAPRGKRR